MIGVEVDVATGLVFPLVRLVEVLAAMTLLLLCTAVEEEDGSGEVVLATTGEEGEEEAAEGEEEGRKEEEAEEVLETPAGEGRIGREYVRRAGVTVEVSLGGAGTRTWGDGADAAFGTWAAVMEGAGVRGGGGEEVVGVSTGAGESRSMGFGVRRGGVGVVGVEGSDVTEEVGGLVPLAASPCSDWL